MTVVSVEPDNTTSFAHAGTDTTATYGAGIVAGRPTDVERFLDLR